MYALKIIVLVIVGALAVCLTDFSPKAAYSARNELLKLTICAVAVWLTLSLMLGLFRKG